MELKPNITVVHLTQEDAALFITYQKRYLFMKMLEDIGFFDLKSGSVEIHKDNGGEIVKVDIHKHLKILA